MEKEKSTKCLFIITVLMSCKQQNRFSIISFITISNVQCRSGKKNIKPTHRQIQMMLIVWSIELLQGLMPFQNKRYVWIAENKCHNNNKLCRNFRLIFRQTFYKWRKYVFCYDIILTGSYNLLSSYTIAYLNRVNIGGIWKTE